MNSRGRLMVAIATNRTNSDSHKAAICAEVTIPDKNGSTNARSSTYKYDGYKKTCDWIDKNNFDNCYEGYDCNAVEIINVNGKNLTVGYEGFNCFNNDTEVRSSSDVNSEGENTSISNINNLEIRQNSESSTSNQLSTSKIPNDYLKTVISTNITSMNVHDHNYSKVECNTDLQLSQDCEPSTSKNPNRIYSNALDIYEFKSDTTVEDDNQKDKDFDINEYMSNISNDRETDSSASGISECQSELHATSEPEFHIINKECNPPQSIFDESKAKRNPEKKNVHCKFCSEDIATKNFLRHLIRKHIHENEVKNILGFPKNSKERRRALGLLRNDTNFNLFIQGIIRPKKEKFKKSVKDTEYIPCAFCKVLILKQYLKRHVKSCTVFAAKDTPMTGKINHVSRSHTMMACAMDPTDVISKLNIKEQIFDLMRGDDISFEAKKDLLIVHFGSSYLKKHKREGIRYACSNRMRELSRLLISSRKIMDIQHIALKDLLHPRYFDNVISAVRNIAGYDTFKKTFKAPSLAMHLGTSLKLACEELVHLILKESEGFRCQSVVERKQWLEDVKNFRKLIETRWNVELASLANKNLQENRWKKPLLLPLISDIKKFREETLKLANIRKQLFLNNDDNESTYKDLVQCVLSLLIVFNRRRIGDVQFLKISDYQADTRHSFTDFDSVLTNTEKVLTKKYKRVINCGKGSKAVVILIPDIIQDFIDILLKNRSKYIPSDNEYIFAIPSSTIKWGKGDVAIRTILKKIKLENAQAFTSNKLRKQIATVMQILNLNKNDIKQFSDFMGHTLKTHDEFYELPVDIYQTAKVSKILLLMEKGYAPGEFKGKSLSDITFNGNTEYAEENDSDDDVAGSVTTLTNSSNVLNVPQNKRENRPTANSVNITESTNSLASEKTIELQDATAAANVRKSVVRKKGWTEEENKSIRKYFQQYIRTSTYPAGSEIKKFISETNMKRNVATVKAKIQHLIKLSKK